MKGGTMGNKINAQKTGSGKFGPYIQDTDKSFHGITEPVSKFLYGKLPAEIEVLEMEGKKISKVKVLSFEEPQIKEASSIMSERTDSFEQAYTKDILCKLIEKSDAKTIPVEMASLAVTLFKQIKKEKYMPCG